MSFAGSFEQTTAMLIPNILGRSSGALISTPPVFLTSDKWEDITLRGGRQHKSQNENDILKRMKENMTHAQYITRDNLRRAGLFVFLLARALLVRCFIGGKTSLAHAREKLMSLCLPISPLRAKDVLLLSAAITREEKIDFYLHLHSMKTAYGSASKSIIR